MQKIIILRWLGGKILGAIERGDYQFEPEYSIVSQNGAIHVYHHGEFLDEIKFTFQGEFPEMNKIEEIIDDYCKDMLRM